MKNLIKAFIQDLQRAHENHEEYQRLQQFYKGQHSEPMALIEFMHLDYLPKRLVKFIHWKINITNRFFAWAWDFHRFSLLTLTMLCLTIYLIFG